MIQRMRILAGLLCCVFACSQPAVHIAYAAETSQANRKNTNENALKENPVVGENLAKKPEDLAPNFNDPDYVKHQILQEDEAEPAPFSLRSAAARTSKSPFTGLTYTHAEQFDNANIVHGIDVSEWQASIDWAKVKNAGVKFAFIRCGYTGLSQTFGMHEDRYFRQNIENAYKAGVQIGIYYFSNSKTTAEAKKEAAKTIELLSGYQDKISLPVVYDFEAFSNAYRAYGISKEQATTNALTFMKAIEKAGYEAINYSSPSFTATTYDLSRLADYDFWLAHYTTRTTYTGNYSYWQYSSTGRVDGISGNVDCDFYYSENEDDEENDVPIDPDEPRRDETVTGLKMKSNTSNSITIKWTALPEAAGYDIYRSSSYGGTYEKIDSIEDAAVSSYKDTSVAKTNGRQYYYKIVPFFIVTEENEPEVNDSEINDSEINEPSEDMPDTSLEETEEIPDEGANVETIVYGQESETLTANTLCMYQRSLRTNATMNLRTQAGTEYASSTVVPLKTVLSFKKYTLSTTGNLWYLVTYKAGGNTYKGYLAGGYITKFTYGRAKRDTYIRQGAGYSTKAKKALPENKKVRIESTANDQNGASWSYVKCTLNGKVYKGYVKTSCIRQV